MTTTQNMRETVESRVVELVEDGRQRALDLAPTVAEKATQAATFAVREPNRRWIKRVAIGLLIGAVVMIAVNVFRSARSAPAESAPAGADDEHSGSQEAA